MTIHSSLNSFRSLLSNPPRTLFLGCISFMAFAGVGLLIKKISSPRSINAMSQLPGNGQHQGTSMFSSILESLGVTSFLKKERSPCYNENVIVILRGASSSGKTRLYNSISKQETHWHAIDLDTLYMHKVVELLKLTFPNEYEKVASSIAEHNIYHAFKRNETLIHDDEAQATLSKVQRLLNGEAGESFQKTLWENIESDLKSQVDLALSKGKDVLMNSWLSDDATQKYFGHHTYFNVLIYTSFPKSFQFYKSRNQQALETQNLSEKRFLGQFFPSFVRRYALTAQKTEKTLEELDSNELETILDEIALGVMPSDDERKEPRFTQVEMNRLEFQKFRDQFFPENLKTHEKVFLQPKKDYDIRVLVQDQTLEELASIIQSKISELRLIPKSQSKT